MLNADWIEADASAGALPATSITTLCTDGRNDRPSAPTPKMSTGATIGERTVNTATTSNRACTASSPTRTRRGSNRSARRPPVIAPTVMPRPNTASRNGMAAVLKPARSTMIGVTNV